MPVQQPNKYELVVNREAAKSIGLTIPEPFLTRADEVIIAQRHQEPFPTLPGNVVALGALIALA